MAAEEPVQSKFQKWLDDELEANRITQPGPPQDVEYDYDELPGLPEQPEPPEPPEPPAPPEPPEPPETALICSPVTEHDVGDACLRLYHDGECGEWCRNPPWPLRSCLPSSSAELSPEREDTELTDKAARQKADAMENLREVRLRKVGRRKVLGTLFDLLAPDPDSGINIEEFAEYLTFVDPSTEVDLDIVHTQLRKVRLDVDFRNVDFETFEAFFFEIEPVLPPTLVAELFPPMP